MKNLIVSLALAIAAGTTPAMAQVTGTDPRAERVFARNFAGAQNIKWTRLDDGYLRATFVLNGIGAESFFDSDAELVGTVRNLFYNQLPLTVLQTISNRFDEAAVIEVKEITNSDGTSYKVVFEQKNKKYKVRLSSTGEFLDIQKEKIKK